MDGRGRWWLERDQVDGTIDIKMTKKMKIKRWCLKGTRELGGDKKK